MSRGIRLFVLAGFASLFSFSASADAPEGWKEEERFHVLGREAYQTVDGGVLALVDRLPAPDGSHEAWFKGYINGKISKYELLKMHGPIPLIDDEIGPVKDGYLAITVSKNEKGQKVIMTFGALIREETQAWQFIVNDAKNGQNSKRIVSALSFLAQGGSKDDPPKKPTNINDILAILEGKKTTKKARPPEPKKRSATKKSPPKGEPKPFVAAPGEGVRSDQLSGVAYDYGEMTMDNVWVHDMPMRIPKWSGSGVYLIFNNGWAYRRPSVAPADLDVEAWRRVEPKKWIRWKDAKLHASTGMMPPLEKGTRIAISVERPNTSSSSRTSVRTSWKSLSLTEDGRFSTGSTTISSRQTGLDSSMGPSTNIVTSSNKDGSFSSVSGNYVAGGGRLQTTGTNRSGGKGNHTGTYFIDGNTIELRYDNGDITRAVFGYDGGSQIIFGGTNYWVPGASK